MRPRMGTPDGDELRTVYRDNLDAVYAFLSYSVDPATAEDLTSATFERMLRSWSSYDPQKASVRTWLLVIARNLLTDHYRRQRHRAGQPLDDHLEAIGNALITEDASERVLSASAVRSWLALLGPREQQVLALHFGADLASTQVAEVMGLTRTNVNQIISRSLRRLRAAALADDHRQVMTERATRPGA